MDLDPTVTCVSTPSSATSMCSISLLVTGGVYVATRSKLIILPGADPARQKVEAVLAGQGQSGAAFALVCYGFVIAQVYVR